MKPLASEYVFEPIGFSAAEVEWVTGVDSDTHRNWRKRGLLGKARSGRTGTPPDEVAALLVAQACRVEQDFYPELSTRHAERIAKSVLAFGLWDAVECGWKAFRWDGPVSRRQEFEKFLTDGTVHTFGNIIGARAAELTVYSVKHGRDWIFENDLRAVFDLNDPGARISVVLDHRAIARGFKKAGRPLFTANYR